MKTTELTPTMQSFLDEVEDLYRRTGNFTSVSVKNQTANALVRRDKLVVVDSNESTMQVRPLVADGTAPFKRAYHRLKGGKHRSKVRNRK